MLAPQAAHADYGGQSPILKWGAVTQLEAKGIMTPWEPQNMEEAFHQWAPVQQPGRPMLIQAVFEATNTASTATATRTRTWP